MSAPGDFPDFLAPPSSVYTELFSGAPGVAGQAVTVGQYNSVIVQVGNNNGTTALVATYQFQDFSSSLLVESGTLSANETNFNPAFPTWTLPVVADTLTVFGTDAHTIVSILGTSQAIRKGMRNDMYPVRRFQGVFPASSAAGTTVQLLGLDAVNNSSPPLANCSNFNGQVLYSWQATAGGPTGDIFCDFRDAAGAVQSIDLLQNWSTTIQRLAAGHPFGYVKWRTVSNAVSPATPTTVTLTIIPMEAPL